MLAHREGRWLLCQQDISVVGMMGRPEANSPVRVTAPGSPPPMVSVDVDLVASTSVHPGPANESHVLKTHRCAPMCLLHYAEGAGRAYLSSDGP